METPPDPPSSPSLPPDLELEVVRSLELPEAERRRALQRLAESHPELAPAIAGYAELAADVAAAFADMPGPEGALEIPEAIGPYRIAGVLGQGGMGTVYLAEQAQPVARKVALKVIKLGMDSAEILARFESERRTLAAMNHDHIAKVFDAGLTDRGQPYFAMEFVEGLPLDRHCDEHRLDTRRRLGLFLQVCEGVQHAHQKGVIHRDLKPSNILVSVQGERTAPKIIDFGLARAVERSGDDETRATLAGQLVGTPGYMSPEQAGGEPQAIDTRTDVYSLGVVLYRLLVGTLPFEPITPGGGEPPEYRRRLQERDPDRPSARLSRLGEQASEIAARRSTDPQTLVRALRGDLDRIAVKALDPDPERRYQGVGELAEDLRRHLRHEPVLAGTPGPGYRLAKFVRRHRVAVGAGSLVLLALVAGLVGTLWQAGIARQRLVETEAALQTAHAVNDFLTLDLLEAARPEESLGRKVTVEEVLKLAALQVGSRFAGEPEIQAAVRYALGESFAKLGMIEAALEHHRTALALRQQTLGPDHRDTLRSRRAVAGMQLDLGDAESAERELRRVYRQCETRFGPEDEETLESRVRLGRLLRSTNRNEEAIDHYRAVLAVRQRTLGPRHDKTLWTMELLGQSLGSLERFAEAIDVLQRTLALRRQVSGDLHPRTQTVINNLANLYHDLGNYAAAEPLYREALQLTEQVYGDRHLEYAVILNNQASLLQDMSRADPAVDRLVEAEEMFRQSLAIRREVWGPQHHRVATSLNNLALVLRDQERYAEARDLMRQVLAIQQQQPELTRRTRCITRYNLASLAGLLDDRQEAARLFAELIPDAEREFAPEHSFLTRIRLGYGITLQFLGRYEEAEPQFVRAHAIAAKAVGEHARLTLLALDRTRNFYAAWNRQPGADKTAELARWEGRLRAAEQAAAGR